MMQGFVPDVNVENHKGLCCHPLDQTDQTSSVQSRHVALLSQLHALEAETFVSSARN